MQVTFFVMVTLLAQSKNKIFSTSAPLKAVLWDVDGTLIDTTALIVDVLSSMFLHFNHKEVPQNELRALIGIPLDQQVRYLGAPEDYGTTGLQMCEFAVEQYEKQRSLERIIPEAIDALVQIRRRGIVTALVTSKNDVELANSLPRLGISAYCDIVIGSDQSAPYSKPHPWPVQLALSKLGLHTPSEAIFIGDSIYDIRAGKAAGVKSAGVLWGASTEAILANEAPDIIFSSPEEITNTLLAL